MGRPCDLYRIGSTLQLRPRLDVRARLRGSEDAWSGGAIAAPRNVGRSWNAEALLRELLYASDRGLERQLGSLDVFRVRIGELFLQLIARQIVNGLAHV